MAEEKIVLDDLINLKDGTTVDVGVITESIDPNFALVKDEVDEFVSKPVAKQKIEKKNFFNNVPNSSLKQSIDSILKVRNVTEERIRKHMQFEYDMKMKRISKIKSKTYRRIKKRERVRKEMELAGDSSNDSEKCIEETLSCDVDIEALKNADTEEKESEESYQLRPIISYNNGSEDKDEVSEQEKIVNDLFYVAEDGINEVEFFKEKEAVVQDEAPVLKETVLPGWNEWAGEGIETVKTAYNTLIERKEGIRPTDRQDFSKANVIINENIEMPDKYKSELPYGYSVKDYTNYIKSPVSLEVNSLRVFNKFVKINKKPESTPGQDIKPNVYDPDN